MMDCRGATALMSAGQERPLGAGERLRLRLHLALCEGCRNFRAQLDVLREAMRRFLHGEDGGAGGPPSGGPA
jgi:hypothetical protein